MKEPTPLPGLNVATLLFLLFFTSCSPVISQFSQHAYKETTSPKVDALLLMDKATENYEKHREEADLLHRNLMKLMEYERNRPLNEVTRDMWEILVDPEGNLLRSFLQRWEKQGPQNAAYIVQKKKQVGNAFDQIAQLESKKLKPEDLTAP
jgi:hypothetical protein